MTNNQQKSFPPDLKHRDWLLQTTIRLIINIDRNVRYSIIDGENDSKHLMLSNITEETLVKLEFITNTDINNNYLYLEDFYVTLDGDKVTPIDIFGLKQIAIQLYNNSDATAFAKGDKFHTPFNTDAFISPITQLPISINYFIDMLTETINILPITTNRLKLYTLVLNPDDAITIPPPIPIIALPIT
jgi:hypothetical protein